MVNNYLRFPEGNQCGLLFNKFVNGTFSWSDGSLIGTALPDSCGKRLKLHSGDILTVEMSSPYKKMTYSTSNRTLINEMTSYISQNMEENDTGFLSIKQFGCTYKGTFVICMITQGGDKQNISIEFKA